MARLYKLHRRKRDFRERIHGNGDHNDLVKDRTSVRHDGKRHGSGERYGQRHKHDTGEFGDKPTFSLCHYDSESGGT